MKICILSMQKVNNYGSILQAYSLKKILENMGNEVSFINIEPRNEEDALIGEKDIVSYSTEIERTLKFNKYIVNKLILKIKEYFLHKRFDEFRKIYLGINGKEDSGKYDLCVIGSDEVFNCLQKAPWGFSSQLLGNVTQANCVITYAACCGATTYERIPESIKSIIISALRNNKAISVRDRNTKEFVEKCIGITPYINLDPVAVGDFSKEIKEHSSVVKKIPKRYCVIYLYQNRIKNEDDIKYLKKFCKTNNLSILAIGETQKWISNHLFVNPFEALAIFQHAEFIITDTFHGTLFGAKYAKKMAVLIRESNKNKLGDLVDRLSLNTHVVKELKDIEKIYKIDLNRQFIDNLLMCERKKTIDYFQDNL